MTLSMKLIKNFNKSGKFLSVLFLDNPLLFNFLIQKFINNKRIVLYNTKNFCIYTKRYRSVYSSFKISRHKFKEFIENQTFFNIYPK